MSFDSLLTNYNERIFLQAIDQNFENSEIIDCCSDSSPDCKLDKMETVLQDNSFSMKMHSNVKFIFELDEECFMEESTEGDSDPDEMIRETSLNEKIKISDKINTSSLVKDIKCLKNKTFTFMQNVIQNKMIYMKNYYEMMKINAFKANLKSVSPNNQNDEKISN